MIRYQVSVYGGYALALKRNAGHASGQAAVDMMASEHWQGALKSKDIVYKFEAKVPSNDNQPSDPKDLTKG